MNTRDIPLMHDLNNSARTASAGTLATRLQDTRQRTLALLEAYARALGPTLAVPRDAALNPPLWEAGHVAWFQAFWIARNQQRERGVACDPDHPRPACHLADADAWYNSSTVAHASRWSLPLPNRAPTQAYLKATLADTLALLAQLPADTVDDRRLYFYRLVLFHEAMHNEAATYMAQNLGIPLPGNCLPQRPALPRPTGLHASLRVPARPWRLGHDGPGFAFDNELPAHRITMPAFEIDATAVSWSRYLPFVESGAHAQAKWWTPEGWAWKNAPAGNDGLPRAAPRYLRHGGATGWQKQVFGHWQPLVADEPAVHLSHHEAEAWCRWSGRRLPTEAEWELAATTQAGFVWGDVWEWTASRFDAYPGFAAHPYRDYSAPWLGTRPVLRGACTATSPDMVNARYRNYFTADRTDIFAGFRSCKID